MALHPCYRPPPLATNRSAFAKQRKPQKMANIFEGTPDARQSTDTAMPTSRFRPRYRALTDDEKALHDDLKAKAVELEALFTKVKPGRYNALALTALEQSLMWIVKELTA